MSPEDVPEEMATSVAHMLHTAEWSAGSYSQRGRDAYLRTAREILAAVLPAVVPPGHVVVARADLEAYLNRGTTGDVLREVHALRRLLAAVGEQP